MTVLETRPGLNDEQLAAIEATGTVFVSAGAGTGKTSVLVERYVRAVCELGLDIDSILVITYTRKAAGELRTRIRAALVERGRPDLARELDGAWISTVHGFCNRLLKAHPFPVGLDPRFRELEDTGAAVPRGEAIGRELTAADREVLQELLRLFAGQYAQAKRRESVVEFEDLQLAARELLRSSPEIRESVELRFRLVMVDEFQDTDRLQCELIDLVAHPDATEIFTVGDEFQSIYGFRHADVEVFRARREQAPNLLTLRSNYRSRPQVLAAVNHLFAGEFGDEFQPLVASAEFADPVFGHPVELLVTDKASYRGSGEHWRNGEARQIAARVREL